MCGADSGSLDPQEVRGLLKVVFGNDKDRFMAAMDHVREYSKASLSGEITNPDLMEVFERLRVTRTETATVVAPSENTPRRKGLLRLRSRKTAATTPTAAVRVDNGDNAASIAVLPYDTPRSTPRAEDGPKDATDLPTASRNY